MTLYSTALGSHDDKRLICPYLQASQVSNPSMRPLVVKLLFDFTCWLLLQLSIELAASLNVRPVFASNELLSVLASFARHPMLYSP